MKACAPSRAGMMTAAVAAAVIASTAAPALAAPALAAQPASSHPLANRPQIAITGVDFRFRIRADDLHAGLITLRFVNHGTAPHQAQFFRLNRGVSFDTFRHDLLAGAPSATDGTDAIPWGGAAMVAPHQTQLATEALQGGRYAVVCFVPGPAGVPHFALGMIDEFTVAGHLSPGQLAALRPAIPAAGVIRAHNLTYTLPPVLHPGALYRFRDTDSDAEVHEISIARLLPGETAADVIAYFRHPAGPPPFIPSGGFGALVPHGLSGWFWLNADPGDYVAFCLVPDPVTHLQHAAMGMVVPVAIR